MNNSSLILTNKRYFMFFQKFLSLCFIILAPAIFSFEQPQGKDQPSKVDEKIMDVEEGK